MTEQETPQAPEAVIQAAECVLRETPQAESIGSGWRWISEAFSLFKQSPGAWIGGMIVTFIIFVVLAFIPLIGQIASYFTGPLIMGGVIVGCTEHDNGGKFQFNHYFAGFSNNTGQLVLLGLFYFIGIILAVALTALLGFFVLGADIAMMELFLDPESAAGMESFSPMSFVLIILIMLFFFIPVSMSIWFSPALIVNHNMAAFSAMMLSIKGCIKNILPFLWYSIILFVLMLVAMIPLMLGLLVMIPVMYASIYTSYRGIFTE